MGDRLDPVVIEAVIADDKPQLRRAIKRHAPVAVSWVELSDDLA